MKTRLWKIIFAVLILCAFSLNSSAEIITIGIEARVDNVEDYDNLLEGKVTVGSLITGTYTYDTSTLDTNPASDIGDYFHYNVPCGIVLNLEDFVFTTDFNNVKFLVEIANVSSGFSDTYLIRSYNNLPLDNGVQVDDISWQLEDNTGTALSNTELPITAPVLSDWQYDNNLVITGGIGGTPPCYEKTFAIAADVTSAVLIPEPMSLFLFGLGLLVIRFFKK